MGKFSGVSHVVVISYNFLSVLSVEVNQSDEYQKWITFQIRVLQKTLCLSYYQSAPLSAFKRPCLSLTVSSRVYDACEKFLQLAKC